MKKIGLGILIAGFAIVVAGIVIAQGQGIIRYPAEVVPSQSENLIKVPEQVRDSSPVIRFITGEPITSPLEITILKVMGCSVMHQLQDATALKCPASVASLFNLREDRVFYPIDLEADVQINADDVWAMTPSITGSGVNVAVLDTGIDKDHPELSDSIVGCQSFVPEIPSCADDYGHGTHVAGIITANGVGGTTTANGQYLSKGVAPGAGIYMYKVCGPIGTSYGCYESDMMAAMEAAVTQKITDPTLKVMSISIGGGNYKDANCDSDVLAAKVNWVVSNGIAVAVAAGNDQFFVSSPACASGAIAVGAVDKSGLVASFSNFGPSLDIVAPGVDIYSTLPGNKYASWSGTSMATPMISGTVALVLQAKPGLTVDEIKTALYATANPINSASVCYGVVKHKGTVYWIGQVACTSDNYGAGIVDAYGAVNYVPPVCGNGIIEGKEQCDDTNLGGVTCQSLGFTGGTLLCTANCTFNTSVCTTFTCTVIPGKCNCNGKCEKKELLITCGDCK